MFITKVHYTHKHINNLLNAKLNPTDISIYYTKTQTNGLFTNYHNKTQAGALVDAPHVPYIFKMIQI
jgi:hypothetical protein